MSRTYIDFSHAHFLSGNGWLMQTHFLGDEEVNAYLRDLAQRVLGMNGNKPEVWVLIGPSGRELAKRLVEVEPKLNSSAATAFVDYGHTNPYDLKKLEQEGMGKLVRP